MSLEKFIFSILLLQRIYHPTSLEDLGKLDEGHAIVCGPVVYVKHQKDGDWHITLDNGKAKVVAEIIPLIPLPVPNKGDTVRIKGIVREDKHHGWYEIHPVESIEIVKECK